MLITGENGHSPFPWDLPLWQSDYAIFFGVLYLVLLVLACGLGIVFMRAMRDAKNSDPHAGH